MTNWFKKKFLSEKHEAKDVYKASQLNTDITIKNGLGEILFEHLHNKVIIPGAGFTARCHFDISTEEITPSYNTALILDNTTSETAAENNASEKVYLFAVGVDGGGSEPSQKYPVDYTKWTAPENLIPFRYVPASADTVDTDVYFGKKTNANGMNAYYFKAFDAEPEFIQEYTDGTAITSNVYDLERSTEAQTYVRLKLKITSDDCRDWFLNTTGISEAKINTISLLTGWAKIINGKKVYQNIRPLTKLNIVGESLVDLTKGIDITYDIYY